MMVKKNKNIVIYFWIFLLLCLSGNPLFCINEFQREVYVIAAVFIFMIRSVKYGMASSLFIQYVIPFVLIGLSQVVALGASISSPIFLLLKIYIGYGIVKIVGRDFMRGYVNVMFVLSIISLVFFAYNTYRGILPGISFSDFGISLGVYTQIARDGFFFINRNSGMFWEPGAFQGYLNLAIAFLFLLPNVNHKWIKFLILVITLLTTKSTTGYFVLGVLSIYYLSFESKISFPKKIILILSLIVLYVYTYTSLDFLQDKIELENTKDETEGGRINDYVKYSSLILSNLFFGISTSVADVAPTGNGFISFLLYFGIFGVSYYFITLYSRYSRMVNKRATNMLCLLVFFTLQGEGFIFYPLYLVLPLIYLNVEQHYKKYI